MKRILIKHELNKNGNPTGYPGYCAPSEGIFHKRGKIDVDGTILTFYGEGKSPEEACSAFYSFLLPDCICGSSGEKCCVHREVEIHKEDNDAIVYRFEKFREEDIRWPRSNNYDLDIIDKWGFLREREL